MSINSPSIVWFRRDLRLDGNLAFQAALKRKEPILAVYIFAPREEKRWSLGGASKVWLHGSLVQLGKELEARGIPFIIRQGKSISELQNLVAETKAGAIFFSRCYEPHLFEKDNLIEKELLKYDITVKSFPGALLFEPKDILTLSGKPYQLFTPFWNACRAKLADLAEPSFVNKKNIQAYKKKLPSLLIDDLNLLPNVKWAKRINIYCQPGEKMAQKTVKSFMRNIHNYQTIRDYPGIDGTSKLSPYLHFGEISPLLVLQVIEKAVKEENLSRENALIYIRQLVWREFAHHLLFHFPEMTNTPLRSQFLKFPWEKNKIAFDAWCHGMTGYPIVDAAMRELWQTGFMHNRLRMIVASFLVKHLLISWEEGAAWFWDTLVDADLANNTLGWQWVAGCGPDAAPYFRIFNPVLQGEKFDSDGGYVTSWLPELSRLPAKWIHKPWQAPEAILKSAGIKLGLTYPLPIIDHNFARQRALDSFKQISRK